VSAKKLLVAGAGQMGAGIVQVSAGELGRKGGAGFYDYGS
jgi:3-hydroxyacyl-CoA dehydrogenase